ncbi:uncharacterized protein LOC109712423 [Ananas comosus]|uniref:Uncharacterized protein LOC109712423 n=1 Tax=Ananas comosus TaxID=4615 RepID=A0A199W9L3_ANACO|nr:uncharacterized protein LOC109712423 [Ananas comosus]OAY85999.1 hypothetical protein ACMD2_19585 [Ananas comosus]
MAKGRRYGADRLLVGTYGYGGGHVSGADLPDLGEEEVWSTAEPEEPWARPAEPEPTARRWAPREDRHVGGLSLAFEDGAPVRQPAWRRHVAASAPVSVPDWPRMLRAQANQPPAQEPETDRVHAEDEEWVPPHVYVAREHARGVAASVFEGVGRTLKGRDMSRVRDAVWSQTGFFG